MNKANTVKLRILDKEVQLACSPGQEDELANAAALVDKSMRDLRLRNNSSSTEKLAIVTAINTAYSLLSERSGTEGDDNFSERLENINKKLDSLLHEDA